MRARAIERRRLALAHCVNVDSVSARREAGDIYPEPNATGLLDERGVARHLTS
jgi:hypothetical protein